MTAVVHLLLTFSRPKALQVRVCSWQTSSFSSFAGSNRRPGRHCSQHKCLHHALQSEIKKLFVCWAVLCKKLCLSCMCVLFKHAEMRCVQAHITSAMCPQYLRIPGAIDVTFYSSETVTNMQRQALSAIDLLRSNSRSWTIASTEELQWTCLSKIAIDVDRVQSKHITILSGLPINLGNANSRNKLSLLHLDLYQNNCHTWACSPLGCTYAWLA